MANNEAGGSGSGGISSSEMQELVFQLNLDAEGYRKSVEKLMKKILEDKKAEQDLARSMEEDKKHVVHCLAQLFKWVREESDEIDLGTKLQQVKEIKLMVTKLIETIDWQSKKYRQRSKAKMDDNGEEMDDVAFTLTSAAQKLSETAQHLTAMKDKKKP